MDLAPDFDEFIASLVAHHVEFVIVGARAGASRRPKDLADIDALSGGEGE
jgi:hypothetical protein